MKLIFRGQNCPVGIAMLICIVVTFGGYQSGYFYLMAMIRILPASDDPPISEPHDSLISRSPI